MHIMVMFLVSISPHFLFSVQTPLSTASECDSSQHQPLSTLKSMAAQVVASSGTPVTSGMGGLPGALGLGLESKAGQQTTEQMMRRMWK